MLNHGINTYKAPTSFTAVTRGLSAVPFFVGCWPAHRGAGFTGKPQVVTNFEEAVKLGGYSDAWRDAGGNPKWTLCQAAYAFFLLFGRSPAVFYNVFDPATHKSAIAAADMDVANHQIKLADAIDDSGLVVKKDSTALVKGTDYETYYDEDDTLVIELISTGSAYSETSLNVAYNAVSLTGITASAIETAIEKVENCKSMIGIVPTNICCPGWSQTPSVAAVMAAKAPSINGLFKGKAIVDLDTSSSGADTYDDVKTYKEANGYTDKNMIVCWPLVEVGDKLFDASVILCGKLAQIDGDNGDVPFESPSNKKVTISGCKTKAGEDIYLTLQQADIVSVTAGVVTFLNFDGWRVWGNHTGCYPGSADAAEHYICCNRMLDYICNTFVNSYWDYVDRPLKRVVIDAIVDSFNSWLTAMTHDGALYGGEIRYVEDNNPTADLISGKFRLDAKVASPVPAQQINMYAEFDVDLLNAALGA